MKAGVEKLRKSTQRGFTKAKRFVETGSTKPSTLSEHANDFAENVEETLNNFSENLEGSLTSWTDSLTAWFWKKCAEAFLETYGFDGYVATQKGVASEHGIERFKAKSLTLRIIITSLLGLPNRLNSDKKLPGIQLWRDSYGGWVPVKRDSKGKAIWTEKHRWQIAAIPFKFLIILPLKLLTLIFKILLNIVKAFTEFAPMLLRATSDALLHKLWKHGEEALNTKIEGVALIFTAIGLIFSGIVVVLFYLATHALHFFGRALTSPEKSARVCFEFGRKYTKDLLGESLSFLPGVFLGLLSIIASAALWAITFPVLISAVATHIPIAVEAAAWVAQLPVLSNILAALKSVSLLPWFGHYLSKIVAVSSFFGVELLSTSTVLLVAAVSYIAAPICAILSRLAEEFSNWWAVSGWNSKEGGPLTSIANIGSTKDGATLGGIQLKVTMANSGKTSSGTPALSSRAKQLMRPVAEQSQSPLEDLAKKAEGSSTLSDSNKAQKETTTPSIPSSKKKRPVFTSKK